MALTPAFADGDAATAAEFNQAVATPGKTGVILAYGRVYYDGAAWQIDASHDPFGLSSPTFASNTLSLVLSNLAAPPGGISVVQNHQAATFYHPRAHTPSNTVLEIKFYDTSHAVVTSAGTSVDVYIIVAGA